ncbi:MSMEG_0565 family glycosyltransferase [Bosea sp. AAP35]|uniref:MSMEG_0565 family glycosyltransferase n=1 Tax=Bosea sp. AAP35 TaxID=1523417 RepID=UPI000A53CB4A|nr:MSMEG_0565 family glycosyltransferase [Bosea sp. AAP35]
MSRSLRIAILAHSINPRGGVVHALALGEALTALGHEAVVHAPARPGQRFFREPACETVLVPAEASGEGLAALVEIRVGDYVAHFEKGTSRGFDVYHAHDGISGNALATLKARGAITGFARTVHHVDAFADPHIEALQARSIVEADRHFVVSRHWQTGLREGFGLNADIVGNGVDRRFFTPRRDGREQDLRRSLGFGSGPVLLAVGGVEERKNTLRMLQAFAQLRAIWPNAQLVIVGGASLLDHAGYQRAFRAELEADPATARCVILAGPQLQADMPALYRLADALVFASVKEGFGLVALEALACGTPVLTSHIPPFTEHFGQDDVVWCDPLDPGSIANGMAAVLMPALRGRLELHREAALALHRWDRTAGAHLPAYRALATMTLPEAEPAPQELAHA